MDFNTQRKIVKALEEKGKNPLLFIPCLIAKVIVIAVLSGLRAVDVALSDKDGNFLGIKRRQKNISVRYEREMAKMAARTERSDDFSERDKKRLRAKLPYRPLWMRAASAMLAAAFAFMIVPEIGVSAAVYAGYPFVPEVKETITYSDIDNRNALTEVDFYRNYGDHSIVDIQPGVFNSIPALTTITLGYSSNADTGLKTNISGNFSGIDENAVIFVRTDDPAAVEDIRSQMSGRNITVVQDDASGSLYNSMPKEPDYVNAFSGVGTVYLEWDEVEDKNGIAGYAVYKITRNRDGSIGAAQKVGDYDYIDGSFDVTGGKCSITLQAREVNSTESYYAVRAYKNIGGVTLYSKLFTVSDDMAKPRQIASAPKISASVNDFEITVTLTGVDVNADYIKLFYMDESLGIKDYTYLADFDVASATHTFTDPTKFKSSPRYYTAVMYYDSTGEHRGDNVRPLANIKEDNYATVETATAYAEKPVLAAPTDFIGICDGEYINFSWKASATEMKDSLYYRLYIDGKEVLTNKISGSTYRLHASEYLNGSNVTAEVQAYYLDKTGAVVAESAKAQCIVTVDAPQIHQPAVPGDCQFTVSWDAFSGAKTYTVYWQEKGDTVVRDSGTLTERTFTKTGLQNEVTYIVWVTADNAKNTSAKIEVTPTNAPPVPTALSIMSTDDKSVTLRWDPVALDNVYYTVTVKNEAGAEIQVIELIKDNILMVEKLENDRTYTFEVQAFRDVNGVYVPSAEKARITGTPVPYVGDILNLSAEPQETSIKVTWTAVKEATRYYLYRTGPDGKTVTIDMAKNTTYADTSVSNNKEYKYMVKAVREVDGKQYDSKESDVRSAKINVYVGAAQNLQAKGSDGVISLTWDKTDKADGYFVEYSSITGSSWTRVGDVSGTAFNHNGLVNGTELKYRVIAYRIVNNESVTSTLAPITVTGRAGSYFPAPADFTVTAGDGEVSLSWSAVDDAEGYEVYVVSDGGTPYLLDKVTKTSAVHAGISNGTTITYSVRAYKTVTNQTVYGDYSNNKTVTVGTFLNAPTDVYATAGDGEVSLKWKKTDGAEGYVVYSYNPTSASFTAVGVVTTTSFTHTGLTNGRSYTYMVAGYKMVDGKAQYSEYSLAVSAVPKGKNTGSTNTGGTSTGGSVDSNEGTSDYRIYITGTTPYGMSNSNVISAFAEKGAFDRDIDVRFTLSGETVTAVQEVLNFYGEGIESFMIYPMDINLYEAGTDKRVQVNPGYYVTLTIPVPDELLPYSQYISVIHVSEMEQLEILPSVHVDVGGVDCIQFTSASFSPFAFVVYLPEAGEDTSAGSSAAAQGSVVYQSAASPAMMCTYLPEIYRRRRRNKVYRITRTAKRR